MIEQRSWGTADESGSDCPPPLPEEEGSRCEHQMLDVKIKKLDQNPIRGLEARCLARKASKEVDV